MARTADSLKTVGTLALLGAILPANLAVTAVALLRAAAVRSPQRGGAAPRTTAPKTIMVGGGKMTKALHLARAFHAAGHRVILIESGKYWLTGHRFSRAVDRFYTVPNPDAEGYGPALADIVRGEGVDVYVPVSSPIGSQYDARVQSLLGDSCEVLHGDPEMVRRLDDKDEFTDLAASLGLPAPEAYRITDPRQVTEFDFERHPGPFILKSIPYDPVHRLDLTRLPAATPAETAAFVQKLPITPEQPWIMQGYLEGQEYCTHSTVRDGEVAVYGCCESSPFQVNYAMADKPAIEAWVRRFVSELDLTGQVSFDFIETADGQLYAIECNPRTHSAITMFYNYPDLASAYLGADVPTARPLPSSRPTYWLYQELWRLLRHPTTIGRRLGVIFRGKDAIFEWSDPLPFLMVHHAQIPWLLLRNLLAGKGWLRIDFNIGKLIEAAGD